jgi:Fe2+ or Zn2+ uptake regulation protein
MSALNSEEKEKLRHAVLEVLVVREGAALQRKQILNKAAEELTFCVILTDVMAALEFLTALGHIKKTTDELGSTEYWQAAPQGILAYERTQKPGAPRHD